MTRPVILVSNDDGVHAPGIVALAAALAPLGRVFTVAPATEQSATSHSMSLSRPLRLQRLSSTRFAVDGTPADSVYVALHLRELLPARPALVVSGINHGLNLGSDVFYSGTVAAAREGALRGVPSIAVSMARSADLSVVGAIARDIARNVLAQRVPPAGQTLLLNVNVPAGRVRGVRATGLGERLYDDIVEIRHDPRGQQYLWIGGPNVSHPPSKGADTEAYEAGWASVTPLGLDLVRTDMMPIAQRAAEAVLIASSRTSGRRSANGGTVVRPVKTKAPRRRP